MTKREKGRQERQINTDSDGGIQQQKPIGSTHKQMCSPIFEASNNVLVHQMRLPLRRYLLPAPSTPTQTQVEVGVDEKSTTTTTKGKWTTASVSRMQAYSHKLFVGGLSYSTAKQNPILEILEGFHVLGGLLST